MMQQYLAEKRRFPDAILMFRLGDFYEMFFEDAHIASRTLGLTLTSRDKNQGADAIPMAGIPHHAASGYIARLCEEGFKVALCEQFEEPGKKGLFRREVSRVVTPGMVLDDASLDHQRDNRLVGLFCAPQGFGIAWLDISTGRFMVTALTSPVWAGEELLRLAPKEIATNDPHTLAPLFIKMAKTRVNIAPAALFESMELRAGAEQLCRWMIGETLSKTPAHISTPESYEPSAHLLIDDVTRKNLELTTTLMEGKRQGSLLAHLDRTCTGMGARLLSNWLLAPLRDPALIEARQEAVAFLLSEVHIRAHIAASLRQIYDLERLNGRLGAGQATPKDMAALRDTLGLLPTLYSQHKAPPPLLQQLLETLHGFEPLHATLTHALTEVPPLSSQEGGIFREGFDAELDELRQIAHTGKGYLLKLEEEERRQTQITSLKIRYNRVFGYAIEVTKAYLHKVPAHYIRKQTLANAERFVTPALLEYEEKVLHAEERMVALEARRFAELVQSCAQHALRIKAAAQALCAIDALTALAQVAADHDYVRPTLLSERLTELVQARHPVVEAFVRQKHEPYVPCDIYIDSESAQLLLITGPNMAGKSTVLRTCAIIQILTQMGAFVPARSARVGLCDQLFTRVGASDNLSQGQSTFMVEMSETATILKSATARSLVVVDEIGRGTSTFDGLSLAWAVAEYLHDAITCRTLFATHYHELTTLQTRLPRVQNFHMAIKETADGIVFLRTLKPGGASRSYGIEVAKLAGLPTPVITRARDILQTLESSERTGQPMDPALAGTESRASTSSQQLQLFMPVSPALTQIAHRLRSLNIESMSPIQALTTLSHLCDILQE